MNILTTQDNTGEHTTPLTQIAQQRLTIHYIRSTTLRFVQHAPCHLCYDERVHEHRDRAPGREETGWTLSRFWIR